MSPSKIYIGNFLHLMSLDFSNVLQELPTNNISTLKKLEKMFPNIYSIL